MFSKILNFYIKRFLLINLIFILIAIFSMLYIYYAHLNLSWKTINQTRKKIPELTNTVQVNEGLYKKLTSDLEKKNSFELDYKNLKNPF